MGKVKASKPRSKKWKPDKGLPKYYYPSSDSSLKVPTLQDGGVPLAGTWEWKDDDVIAWRLSPNSTTKALQIGAETSGFIYATDLAWLGSPEQDLSGFFYRSALQNSVLDPVTGKASVDWMPDLATRAKFILDIVPGRALPHITTENDSEWRSNGRDGATGIFYYEFLSPTSQIQENENSSFVHLFASDKSLRPFTEVAFGTL